MLDHNRGTTRASSVQILTSPIKMTSGPGAVVAVPGVSQMMTAPVLGPALLGNGTAQTVQPNNPPPTLPVAVANGSGQTVTIPGSRDVGQKPDFNVTQGNVGVTLGGSGQLVRAAGTGAPMSASVTAPSPLSPATGQKSSPPPKSGGKLSEIGQLVVNKVIETVYSKDLFSNNSPSYLNTGGSRVGKRPSPTSQQHPVPPVSATAVTPSSGNPAGTGGPLSAWWEQVDMATPPKKRKRNRKFLERPLDFTGSVDRPSDSSINRTDKPAETTDAVSSKGSGTPVKKTFTFGEIQETLIRRAVQESYGMVGLSSPSKNGTNKPSHAWQKVDLPAGGNSENDRLLCREEDLDSDRNRQIDIAMRQFMKESYGREANTSSTTPQADSDCKLVSTTSSAIAVVGSTPPGSAGKAADRAELDLQCSEKMEQIKLEGEYQGQCSIWMGCCRRYNV